MTSLLWADTKQQGLFFSIPEFGNVDMNENSSNFSANAVCLEFSSQALCEANGPLNFKE